MKKNQIDIITLGCSKNLVDSELLMKQFEANGYHCVHDSKRPQGEIAVINTCGFIEDAKQESIDTILEFIQAKEEGRLNKLYVMGWISSTASSTTRNCSRSWVRPKCLPATSAAILPPLTTMHTSRFQRAATAAAPIAPFRSSRASTFPVLRKISSTRCANW